MQSHHTIMNIKSYLPTYRKKFLDIGSNFPFFFKIFSWFLILTITNHYYSLFYLLLHATMTFHFMNSTPTNKKVTTTNCTLHKVQESCHLLCVCRSLVTGGSTRELLALLEVNSESLKQTSHYSKLFCVYCSAH